MNIIETEHLTKYYGAARGILNVDMTIQQQEIFGFIGPNGAGKSTTIRTLLGFLKPTSGSAKVLGMDCRENEKYFPSVGYMPSEAMFYPTMKVKEVIALSAKLRNLDCAREAAVLCQRFELDGNKKIEELSLGNRKKVSIVCAFQHRPQLYILDEPTSGLDPLMQKEFFALLHERNQEGATVFLSSHVLSEIAKHCHRAAIIKEGSIIALDKVENLMKTSAKKITIHGIHDLAMDGMYGIEKTEDTIKFLYGGEIPALIHALYHLPITDLTIAEPDLEEVFLHFYGGQSR